MLYLTLKLFLLAERKGDIGKSAYKTTALFNAFRIVEFSSNILFWGFFFFFLDDDKHGFWDLNIYHSYHFTI